MKALKNMQTKDRIAQAIRNEILEGNIEPGEELVQEELAEMLGVSRMPVREALQTLVQEGFARRMPNRHIQAVVLDSRQLHNVFAVAAAMEAEMVRIASENQGDVGELRRILACMEKAAAHQEKVRYESEFHDRIMGMAENPYLEQLQRKLMDGYVSYAIEQLGDKNSVRLMLERVTEEFEKGNFSDVRKGLEKYYLAYADEAAERWKR